MKKRYEEAGLQAAIIGQATFWGWWVYHPRLAMYSQRGWPDLTLIKPPRIIFAELKATKGKISPSQAEIHDLLLRCPGVEFYVWHPKDFDAAVAILRGTMGER